MCPSSPPLWLPRYPFHELWSSLGMSQQNAKHSNGISTIMKLPASSTTRTRASALLLSCIVLDQMPWIFAMVIPSQRWWQKHSAHIQRLWRILHRRIKWILRALNFNCRNQTAGETAIPVAQSSQGRNHFKVMCKKMIQAITSNSPTHGTDTEL